MSTIDTRPAATGSVYSRLGLDPVINANGTVTILGGSIMPEEVVAAMREASRSYVDLPLLLRRSGEYLAGRIGVPAAFISTGAAGGIAVGIAGILSGGQSEGAWSLPDTAGRPNEIIVLRTAEPNYMHQAARMVGGKIVSVGEPGRVTVDDFAAAINERTAAILYVYPYLDETLARAGERAATLSAVAAVAQARGVPVVVDAAAELPPREKLSRFHREGGDLVIFSGGKGMCGPQSTGLVVGRSDLIEACLLNSNPNSAVGRGMKVGKEEVAGLVRAVELFLERDETAVFAEWSRRAHVVADRLANVNGIRAHVEVGDPRGRPPEEPRCYVDLLDPAHGTPSEVVDRLASGTPSVRVRVLSNGFFVSTMTLQEGEEAIVAERIAAVLS